MATNAADDLALVRRMVRGDEEAFSLFFDRQFPALFRFAMSRLSYDADLAEDVVQATMIQAMRKIATFRGEAAVFTWLCTFCRHEISARFRKRRRAALVVADDADALEAALARLTADEADDPDAGLDREDLKGRVQSALGALPQHYGRALTWKYLHDLPVLEIARRLEIGGKAAESLLTRARQAFRASFNRDALPHDEARADSARPTGPEP